MSISFSPWLVLSEIEQDVHQDAMQRMAKKLPFTNLFGKGVTRVVVPYVAYTDTHRQIDQELKQLGYDRVNWAKGEVSKTVPVHPKAPPGTRPKVQNTSLGKAIMRLPGREKLVDWWSRQKEHEKDQEQFSIVISRNPIDVVRMSDHKNIASCHSPGGGYWSNCLQEMKHGGLVAYLVRTEDITKLTPQQIASKDDIFRDDDRDQDGIEPITRLRLRRFTYNDDNDINLAVPELRTYGKTNAEFQRQVTDWAKEKQQTILGNTRLRARDFHRRGGKYSDNSDGELFNRFFGDHLDSGNTGFGAAGKEGEDLAQQQRDEIEAIDARWQRELKYASISYEEYDGDGEDEDGVTFYWDGSISVEIPSGRVSDEIEESDLNNRRYSDRLQKNLKQTLYNALTDANFYVGRNGITMDDHSDSAYLYIDITPEDETSGGPDDYDSFCQSVYRDWDSKYEEVRAAVYKWLVNRGFIESTPVRNFQDQSNLTHFQIMHEDGELEAIATAPIGTSSVLGNGPGYHNPQAHERFLAPVQEQIKKMVFGELQRIVAMHKARPRQQQYLPGFDKPPQTSMGEPETYDLSHFQIGVQENVRVRNDRAFALTIKFSAHDATTQEEMNQIKDLIGTIDNIFPRIVSECGRWLQNYDWQFQRDLEKDRPVDEVPFEPNHDPPAPPQAPLSPLLHPSTKKPLTSS